MEILYWLVPPALVTLLAMLWVGWLGREGRGEVDREVAVRRLATALAKEPPPHARVRPRPPRDRSTGLAVRPSRATGSPAPHPTAPHPTGPGDRPRRTA